MSGGPSRFTIGFLTKAARAEQPAPTLVTSRE